MQFLKPNNISGEIMNLFDEAKEKVVIVSPYCKFDKWFKLVAKIKKLRERNIEVEFYIRDNEKEAYDQVMELGITPITVANLHAKLYFNENKAIVTSMNLLLSSEINSIDIGYLTESHKEYNEITDFYATYLKKQDSPLSNDFYTDWRELLNTQLASRFSRVRIYENEGVIQVKTSSNTYEIFVWNNNRRNILRICGIVSGKEFEYANTIKNTLGTDIFSVELQPATQGYNTIWATSKKELRSVTINFLENHDTQIVVNTIVEFIIKVEDIKEYCYLNRKTL
ncbi:hypothetical protein [Flavobacterium psychrotrophum]|uniref:hypothetical protein n=1 Tax=Flavobacterium psychrotrophum TaxID=2294119 RepID=UPI000E310192|nr:hypothetical protein [Flavobacterium psychrotrophum]